MAPDTPLALVLFGSPGSGKGTQGRLLMTSLGIPQISTGDMLREHIRKSDGVGQQVQATMLTGALVSDEVVNRLVAERIALPDCERGFILDGYPRTRAQAESLSRMLKGRGVDQVVIHLIVDYNIIINRLSGRRHCPVCGTLYNDTSKPPKADNVCDLDCAPLVVREDDRESVIRERLAAYERQTRPLIEYFRETGGRLYEIEAGHEAPNALFERICREIERNDHS